jgi:multimeric flavodoxin WrbA
MNTIIINGSPKGNAKNSNSRIYAEEFVRNMQNPPEIRCLAGADYRQLAQYIQDFDTVIFIMPLYIHAMPGIVMKFIEVMEPLQTGHKYMGFIVQAGFMETSQHRYLEPYLADLTQQLGYTYLGTVSKGEAAGTYMYPHMFKKVFALLNDLGTAYEQTHAFDSDIVEKLSEPYELSGFKLGFLNLVTWLGLMNIGWHTKLRKNNAMKRRLDKPFL